MVLPGNKRDWNCGRKWNNRFSPFRIIYIIEKACSRTGSTLSAAGLFSLFNLELLLFYCTPGISMVSGPVIPIEASAMYPFQKMGV